MNKEPNPKPKKIIHLPTGMEEPQVFEINLDKTISSSPFSPDDTYNVYGFPPQNVDKEYQNPYDSTVPDPFDQDQAIEDPIHGTDAILESLSIPPFRKEDGTYHVFGALYVCGTTDFDANGLPFNLFRSTASNRLRREALELMEWTRKYRDNELPPREEMDLPAFRLDLRPYLVIKVPEDKEGTT